MLTFTNKAANELVERMRASAIPGAADVWAGTFHSFGLEFLRKYHDLFGLHADIAMVDKLAKVRLMTKLLPRSNSSITCAFKTLMNGCQKCWTTSTD